jgi:hypothetical protein
MSMDSLLKVMLNSTRLGREYCRIEVLERVRIECLQNYNLHWVYEREEARVLEPGDKHVLEDLLEDSRGWVDWLED